MVKPKLDALSCGPLGFVMDNSAVISASVAIDFSAGQGVSYRRDFIGRQNVEGSIYIQTNIHVFIPVHGHRAHIF